MKFGGWEWAEWDNKEIRAVQDQMDREYAEEDEGEDEGEWVDPDPQCAICGVHRSEHALCGCLDGFSLSGDY